MAVSTAIKDYIANMYCNGTIAMAGLDDFGIACLTETLKTPLPAGETHATMCIGEVFDWCAVNIGYTPDICGWIDEVGIETLTRDHTLYVFYLSLGATGFAEVKYQGLIPKPSPILGALAIRDNALGIYYYSRGSITMANIKTGCSF